MSIIRQLNIQLSNPDTKTFLADAFYPEHKNQLPLVIFCHGYKGYKDWGAWNIMAEKMAAAGCFFVKFNFSHNGTTLAQPTEFADLEAFGNDNFTKQLSDLQWVIDYFSQLPEIDVNNIYLVGHSRGGGVVSIKAVEDSRIKGLVTLAGVDRLDFFPKGERLQQWKTEGVFYSLNGRTQQQMPHYLQLLVDYELHSSRFNIGNQAKKFKGKSLIIHGTNDEAVAISAAEHLHSWLPHSECKIIEGANHTFGAKEPWLSQDLPKDLDLAVDYMLGFFG